MGPPNDANHKSSAPEKPKVHLPKVKEQLHKQNVATVREGKTVVAENTWQATRLKALQDAKSEEVEVGQTDPRTIPEVPFTRRAVSIETQPGVSENPEQPEVPQSAEAGDAESQSTSEEEASREWKDIPTIRLETQEAFDSQPEPSSKLTLEQLYSLGIALEIPVTYRVRSMFFVGNLKMVSQRMLYIQTKRRPPVAGERVLVNIPVQYGTRSQFITLVTRVNYIDLATDDDAGGFEASISSIDERSRRVRGSVYSCSIES
mgnify:CR=1 FL=1